MRSAIQSAGIAGATGQPLASLPARLMLDPIGGWDACARRNPPLVGLKLQAELVVKDPQIAVAAAHDRLRHDGLHLLRHYADVGSVAAVIGEAIISQPIAEMAKKDDVV